MMKDKGERLTLAMARIIKARATASIIHALRPSEKIGSVTRITPATRNELLAQLSAKKSQSDWHQEQKDLLWDEMALLAKKFEEAHE